MMAGQWPAAEPYQTRRASPTITERHKRRREAEQVQQHLGMCTGEPGGEEIRGAS
jgi:hypothetical protein